MRASKATTGDSALVSADIVPITSKRRTMSGLGFANIWIGMAIVISVFVMMLSAGTISDFIDKHPSLKMLALSFLLVVGTVLIAESFDVHVPKGYVYFAMAFSLAVEAVNIKMRTAIAKKQKQQDPVKLRKDIPGQ